ncbi:MAG: hypothetical protein A2X56_13075 [Nitrospirae bacterium GWC2_57_13]|nr:MAG: hypothetical protein A2X56_13075 [Nitrospirae bacterium GWC2_57_13]
MKRILFWKVLFVQVVVIAFALVLFGAYQAGAIRSFCFVVLLPLLVSAILSGIVYWSMRKRLEALSGFTRAIAGGEFQRRLIVHRRDVTSRLKEDLNTMAESLADQIRDLQGRMTTLELALTGMADGVLILDPSGRVAFSNNALRTLFGVPGDSGGKPFLEAVRHHGLAILINRAMQERSPLTGELELLFPIKAFVAASILPIIKESMREDVHLGTAVIIRDITKIRDVERVRKDFVANVSHELKTPIAAIRGFAETLLDGAMNDKEEASGFLGVIQSHAARLQRLVDDLLTLSRIELGAVSFSMASHDVGPLIEDAVQLIKPQADAKQVAITIKTDPGLQPVHADRDRIAQVLLNLLDNAVKFAPPGGAVWVLARNAEDKKVKSYEDEKELAPSQHPIFNASGDFIEISIEDTGPGIPPQLIPRLGERFYRVDPARSRELGGTGLGLAIVKHLLQAHGSSLVIENARRGGTIVSLRLSVSPSLSRGSCP